MTWHFDVGFYFSSRFIADRKHEPSEQPVFQKIELQILSFEQTFDILKMNKEPN